MKVPWKRLVLAALVLALAALTALAFRPGKVPVETALATRGPLRVSVAEEGVTRVRHRFVIGAPAAGRLERIGLDEGDPVEPGTVVARMAPLPLDPRGREQAEARLRAAQAAEREAEARVAAARTALEEARRTQARKERLAELIPPDELDAARTETRTHASELEAARFRAQTTAFETQSARAALHEGSASPAGVLEIRSPVRGRILKVCEECERVVEAGAPLVELGDPADLEVVVDVLSSDAVHIRPGTEMLLRPGEEEGEPELRARVRKVEPSGFTKVSPLGVEEQRVNVIADLADPPGAIGDRFRVEASLILWQGEDVLKVPAGALFRDGAGWSVYVTDRGRARLRGVRIGHRNPSEVEILAGLQEGETVVVHPGDQVKDGARIAVRRAG